MVNYNDDLRWVQRYENFKRSFHLLEEAIKIDDLSQLERAGIIQFFEMSFELSWKLLKDYLDEEGYSTKSPRETIKQAYQNQIILNGHQWLYALNDRNLTVHTYDEDKAIEIENKIRKDYFPLIKELQQFFNNKIKNQENK